MVWFLHGFKISKYPEEAVAWQQVIELLRRFSEFQVGTHNLHNALKLLSYTGQELLVSWVAR